MSIPNPAGRIRWLVGLAALLLASLLAQHGAPVAGAAERRVEVIVQMEAGTQAPSRDAVRRAGGSITARLPIVNGFSARVPARKVSALAALPGVRSVTRNAAVEAQDVRASDVTTAFPFSGNAPQSWNTDTAEATGKGVGVAVIDTGIAGDLPDFRVSTTDTRSRVIASAIVHPDAVSAGDGYGHGTHVAGIIAGNSWHRGTADLARGKYLGIAPEANLIDVKVSDELGNATVLDVIVGLQFVVDHKDVLGIRIVNLSLESTQAGSYTTDPLDAAVESAWFSGLVVVASAGNRGVAADAVSYAPGNDPYVISVGAVDDAGTKADSDDLVAAWSARGTTQDGFAKPDLHAPGARIVSNLAPNSQFGVLCPTCIVTGGMIRAGGTSMSAPMVSGAVALLLEKYPQLTPNQVKGVLKASARLLPGGISAVDAFAGIKKVAAGSVPVANAGLVPNELVDPATGAIDYTRSSWSRSSWSDATGLLRSSWSRSSWSRSSWSSTTGEPAAEPNRSSWSRSSWSTSWTK